MSRSIHEQLERDRTRARDEGRELARIACQHSLMRTGLALARLQRIFERKYRPDQPRLPGGQPGGGQFAEGEGSGDVALQDSTGRTRVAQLEPRRGNAISLREEEARGGHTIRKHVGKSDEEMLTEARKEHSVGFWFRVGIYREGSFAWLEDANNLTNQTLGRNQNTVDEVAKGQKDGAFVKERFWIRPGAKPLGCRSLAPSPTCATPTASAFSFAMIARRREASGFTRHTLGMTRRPSMYPSQEFHKMCERFFQDVFDVNNSLDEVVKKRLREFLSEIISDRYSDEQLQNLWGMTSAEVGFTEGLRKILTMIRDHIDAASHGSRSGAKRV